LATAPPTDVHAPVRGLHASAHGSRAHFSRPSSTLPPPELLRLGFCCFLYVFSTVLLLLFSVWAFVPIFSLMYLLVKTLPSGVLMLVLFVMGWWLVGFSTLTFFGVGLLVVL
jgi:hypothetical protein